MTTITHDQLIKAVLSLDVYHRGHYNTPGLSTGTGVYDFTVGTSSEGLRFGDNNDLDRDIGFFAQEYTGGTGTIIAYRGTDDLFKAGTNSDQVNGFGIGVGRPDGPQAQAA